MSKGMLGTLPLSAVRGPRDTLENNLAGENGKEWLDALNRFLRKENPWADVKANTKPRFRLAEDGIISFSVKSDGTSGNEWVKRLRLAGHKVEGCVKEYLCSADFTSTDNVVTNLVVLPGTMWWRTPHMTENIWDEARKRELVKPNPEIACLIRMMFTNTDISEMGLFNFTVMHEPIKVSDFRNYWLSAYVGGSGASWLRSYSAPPDYRNLRRYGFVFAVSSN